MEKPIVNLKPQDLSARTRVFGDLWIPSFFPLARIGTKPKEDVMFVMAKLEGNFFHIRELPLCEEEILDFGGVHEIMPRSSILVKAEFSEAKLIIGIRMLGAEKLLTLPYEEGLPIFAPLDAFDLRLCNCPVRIRFDPPRPGWLGGHEIY